LPRNALGKIKPLEARQGEYARPTSD